MSKKILSLILGGTMLAASAFAFAGCGHKHNFEVRYKIADCDDEGYTIHTCKDCGYMYADEFIAPYGHAYRNYYHPKEESTVKAAPYALDWGSGSEPVSTFTPEQLQRWQAAGTDACVHRECEFCDHGLPEDLYLSFLESTKYMAGVDYVPVYYEQMNPHPNSPCAIPIPVLDYKPGTARKYAAASSESAEYVQKITVYANEFNIGEAEYDELHLLIPDCIETIEDEGFGNCEKLERVYLSKNLKTIGKNVFKGSSLDSVIIPKSLQSIGSNAFANCTDLKIVFFSGTEAEWNAIQIETGNDALKNAPRYYYSESKPTTSGNFWHYVEEEATLW